MPNVIKLSQQEWNDAWDKNEIQVLQDNRKGFLMFSQIFKGTILYKAKKWRATAWSVGGENAFVELTEEESNVS